MGRLHTFAGLAALGLCILAAAASAVTRHGGPGADRMVGTASSDTLRGLEGHDTLLGGRGADVLIGGHGRDHLVGGDGHDGFNMRNAVAVAAPGRDRIDARDGGRDEINCGDGNDLAIVDAVEDGVYDCEVVREPNP